MTLHANSVFAPIDPDQQMQRVAGGNETEVYCTDDRRTIVKLKSDQGGSLSQTLNDARLLRAAAECFRACLGPRYSIPSHYLIARDEHGLAHVLIVQPFLVNAQPLFTIDYAALSADEREAIAAQLHDIMRRALNLYRTTGRMPDLYGRTSKSHAERKQLNTPAMLPWRLWSFLVQRNLLRAHNLLLTDAPDRRIILVDYDPVRRGRLYQLIYYTIRWMLFWRDHILLLLMRRGMNIPPG